MGIKQKRHLNQFTKSLASFIIILVLYGLAKIFIPEPDAQVVINTVFYVILLLFFTVIHTYLNKTINFAYKIVVIEDGTSITYKAKVLQSWFLVIIVWRCIESSYDNYNFSSIDSAKRAISNHKLKAKEQLKEYFERKVKRTVKTIRM